MRRYDLVIVGMGSAGMTAAEFASTLPIKVAAVERGRLGGDCLWTGCVPSKALLASAKVAHHMRSAGAFGIAPVEPEIDTAKVFDRIRQVQQRIAATDDSPQRFRDELGVDLIEGTARLTGPTTLDVDGERIETRFVLLATGSRPLIPPIDGLAEAGHLDSESVWELDRAPESLVILGGGPIAMEMAQGFRRLGVRVTVLERAERVLGRDEPELAERLLGLVRTEGADVRLGTEAVRVTVEDGLKVVHTDGGERFAAHEIVVAVGRQPNVEGLGLDAAGVEVGDDGIAVDGSLRTSAPSVYAAGDVIGGRLFTHAAGYEAARAVRNMFFPGREQRELSVPWCVFTDPELAHAGLTEAQARERFGDDAVRVHRQGLDRSDRGRTDATEDGEVVIVTRKGEIVGAHVLAPGAGELIGELALAIEERMDLADLGSLVHVYPAVATELSRLGGEVAAERALRLRFLVRSKYPR